MLLLFLICLGHQHGVVVAPLIGIFHLLLCFSSPFDGFVSCGVSFVSLLVQAAHLALAPLSISSKLVPLPQLLSISCLELSQHLEVFSSSSAHAFLFEDSSALSASFPVTVDLQLIVLFCHDFRRGNLVRSVAAWRYLMVLPQVN